MENFIDQLKSVSSVLNTSFIKLYLLIFYILNATYLSLDLYKFRLRELFLLNEEQKAAQLSAFCSSFNSCIFP
jgi:hypothetical protein